MFCEHLQCLFVFSEFKMCSHKYKRNLGAMVGKLRVPLVCEDKDKT